MSKTAWLIVMAPDGLDQWDIEKWTYWRSGSSLESVSGWVKPSNIATAYATQEEAEATAFDLTMKNPRLTGSIHVWRFEQPVENLAGIRPWRRVDE